MSRMIFRDWAEKYFEAGIGVMPLNGKFPVVKQWQRWARKEQTEDELEYMIQRMPNKNIGAVIGKKFCVLDVDIDDPRILQAIPYTPIRRKGRSGRAGCYFYKANTILSRADRDMPFEFLNHGRQVVLPPSIHPDTSEQYQWIGDEDIFTCDFDTLPEITEKDLDTIEELCRKNKIIRQDTRRKTTDGGVSMPFTDEGRNNRLASIAYAMACDDVEKEEGTNRLLEIDKKEHDTPWFSDPTEPHRGKDAKKAACKMYQRALKKATETGDRRAITSTICLTNSPNIVNDPIVTRPPKPRGLMKIFQDYCNSISVANQDGLGLGGAISLMATLASNRFYTVAHPYVVYPNIYVINLAHSGFGKETPQRALDEALMGTDLLGSATYKSGSSIVMGLDENPIRLDVIDECAMILKAMAAREDYKADIVDVLSSLYSKSNSYFHGFTSKGDGKNFGACWNPCVNILGSTTPQGFRSSVNKDMAAKGLLPRFLIFRQSDPGDFKRNLDPKDSYYLKQEMMSRVKRILSAELKEYSEEEFLLENSEQYNKKRYEPELIEMTDAAQGMITDIQEKYFNEGRENPEGFESAFKNRFAQHVAKLSLLDALGLGLCEVGTDSVEWAHEVVKWQWEATRDLYELASAENEHEKINIRMLNFIKSKCYVTASELTLKFRMVPGYQRKDVINSLIESGAIEKVKLDSKGGRKALAYRAVYQ